MMSRLHGCACVQNTVDEAVEVLNAAKQELDFTKTGEDAEALQAALREAAAAYKALHIKARSAGVPVPKDAAILADAEVVWAKDDLIGARDWMRFEDAGWVVMDELPEVPEIFDRTFFLAQDQGDPPDAIVPVGAPPSPPLPLAAARSAAPAVVQWHVHEHVVREVAGSGTGRVCVRAPLPLPASVNGTASEPWWPGSAWCILGSWICAEGARSGCYVVVRCGLWPLPRYAAHAWGVLRCARSHASAGGR